MTEPDADKKARAAGPFLRINFSWLRLAVSWKALAVLVTAGVAALALFIYSGVVDISADKPDGWLSYNFLHIVFKRSMAFHGASVTPPDDLSSPSRVRLAAQHFEMVCSNCHSRPGFGQSVIALSMSPHPQYLPKVLDQLTDRQLYVILEHGVKYSAMPSWPTADRGDEVWSMVAFLRQLAKMDAKTYQDMTALPTVAPVAATSLGQGWTLRPADPKRNSYPFTEFAYAAPSHGFADDSIHQSPVATCARCHGADGSGAATGGEAPNLTLQDASYLQAALGAYTRGTRKSGYMQTIAAELSSGQSAALATYFASLPVKSAGLPVPADPQLLARGQTIATEGIRENAVPACGTCHESSGSAIIGAPHLAGQNATYLRRELTAMSHGGRGSTVMWNPMPTVSHELSPADITAVSAYYAGLKPTKGASAGAQNPQPNPVRSPPVDLIRAKQIFQSACIKCHVNAGRGDVEGNYPDLTLQSAPYVAQQLYDFRTRQRLNAKMQGVTNNLTFDEMTSLASYVSSLEAQPALEKPNAAAAARGAAIAMHGVSARGVPACLSCHGAAPASALPLIPHLQGQNVAYLRKRLDQFSRPYPVETNALNPMQTIATQLTDKERADLAAYFAAAPMVQKSAPRS